MTETMNAYREIVDCRDEVLASNNRGLGCKAGMLVREEPGAIAERIPR